MKTNPQTTEDDIRIAARQHGAVDVQILRQRLPLGRGSTEAGEWHLLFCDSQLWGRRRTLAELLVLAQRGSYRAHEKKARR